MKRQKQFFPQLLTLLVALVCVVVLLPFVEATLHAWPRSDDFYLTKNAIDKGTLAFTWDYYHVWSGRLASTFATSLIGMKVVPDISAYRLEVLAIILFFIYAMYFLFDKLFNGQSRSNGGLFGLILALSILANMDGLRDLFYWHTGIFHYTFALCLLLIAGGLWYSGKYLYWLPLLFAYICLSFELLNVLALLMITLRLGQLYFNNAKIKAIEVIIIVVVLACTAVVFLSPGARMRAEGVANPHAGEIMFGIKHGTKLYFEGLNRWFNHWAGPSYLIFGIAAFSIGLLSKKSTVTTPKILVLFVFMTAVLYPWLNCFVVAYGVGETPYVMKRMFAMGTIALPIFFSWACHLLGVRLQNKALLVKNNIISPTTWTVLILVGGVLAFYGRNTRKLKSDYISGSYELFDHQMSKVFGFLNENAKKHIILPRLKTNPFIYAEYPSENPNYWINRHYKKYFELASIRKSKYTNNPIALPFNCKYYDNAHDFEYLLGVTSKSLEYHKLYLKGYDKFFNIASGEMLTLKPSHALAISMSGADFQFKNTCQQQETTSMVPLRGNPLQPKKNEVEYFQLFHAASTVDWPGLNKQGYQKQGRKGNWLLLYKSKEYPDTMNIWDAWNNWVRPDLFPDYRAREGEWNAYNFRIVTGKQEPNPDGSIELVKRVKPQWEKYLVFLKSRGVNLVATSTTYEDH